MIAFPVPPHLEERARGLAAAAKEMPPPQPIPPGVLVALRGALPASPKIVRLPLSTLRPSDPRIDEFAARLAGEILSNELEK